MTQLFAEGSIHNQSGTQPLESGGKKPDKPSTRDNRGRVVVSPQLGGSEAGSGRNPRVPFRFAPLHPWLIVCNPLRTVRQDAGPEGAETLRTAFR